MRFDGVDADAEMVRGFLRRVAFGDMLEHVALGGGQSVEQGDRLHRRRRPIGRVLMMTAVAPGSDASGLRASRHCSGSTLAISPDPSSSGSGTAYCPDVEGAF